MNLKLLFLNFSDWESNLGWILFVSIMAVLILLSIAVFYALNTLEKVNQVKDEEKRLAQLHVEETMLRLDDLKAEKALALAQSEMKALTYKKKKKPKPMLDEERFLDQNQTEHLINSNHDLKPVVDKAW